MDSSILQKLTEYVVTDILKQRNRDLDPDRKLISTGLIDSFSLVDLALYVEETYRVKIEDSELNSQTFDTMNELVRLVESRRK